MTAGRSTDARLSIPEVVREGLTSFRANAGLLLLCALVVAVPVATTEVLGDHLEEIGGGIGSDGLVVGEAITAAIVLTITGTLGEVFYAGVVVGVVTMRRTGIRRDLIEIARHLPYLRLLAVDAIFVATVAIGLVLLIVPGILALGWFALAAPVIELEGRGVRGALRRSRELVRGNFWRVIAILVPALVASDLLTSVLKDAAVELLGDGVGAEWLSATLGEALTAPLFAMPVAVIAHQLIGATTAPDQNPGRSSSRAAAS